MLNLPESDVLVDDQETDQEVTIVVWDAIDLCTVLLNPIIDLISKVSSTEVLYNLPEHDVLADGQETD